MQKGKKVLNNWNIVRLSEAVRIIGGGTPKTSVSEYWNGNIPWLSPPDFNSHNRYVEKTKKTITEKGLNNSATTLLQTGDLILSARGTVGALAQLKKPMAFSQTSYGLRGKLKSVSNDFLFYVIKHNIKKFKKLSYGAVFNTITTKTFDEIKILLPSLQEQKRIVEILSTWDQAVETLDKLISAKEKQFKWLLKEIIGDQQGNPNWQKVRLEEICLVKKGSAITRNQIVDGNIPVIAGGQQPAYYHNEANRQSPIITVSSSGAYAGFVNFFLTPIYASDCSTIQPISSKKGINIHFIYHILKAKQNYVYKLQKGGGQPHVYKDDLDKLTIFLPQIKVQERIVSILSIWDQEIEQLKQLSDKYQEQKKGIMQQLLIETKKLR